MKKGKAITLLSILSVLVAFVLVMTFIRFPVGIKNYNSALGAIELDYDIEGGVAYTMSLAKDNEEEVEDVNVVIETVKERLDALGYGTYTVKAIKSTEEGVEDYDIRIELKKTDSVASDIEVVTAFGKVKFYGGSSSSPTTQILEDVEVVADSQYLGMVEDGNYAISIVFRSDAKDELVKLINAEESYYLKITCGEDDNGEEKVLFNSTIMESAFDGNVLGISGISSEASANQMALQMRSGGLAYKYDVEGGETVSSPYGADVALKCAVAEMTLFLVIIILLCAFYKGLGLIASLSVLLFILGETWLMIGVPGITLNIGGVIGIISATLLCAVGMVMLSKRVKEEYANSEKTVKAAINKGFKESLVPTVNIHVVSGIIALLLLAFTGGVVKCFAITFGIGVVVSMIATLLFTKMYTALILPLVKDKEKFLRFKKAEPAVSAQKETEV